MSVPESKFTALDDLLTRYAVDRAHARRVADHALQLYDVITARMDWPAAARGLLEAAALLHNVGLHVSAERHHTVGRDIVVGAAALPPVQAAIVAVLISLHRKRPRAQLEPMYWAVRPRDRRWVVQLAALLRVADGLDVSQTQTTELELTLTTAELIMHCSGPAAAADQQRALDKADLWREVLPLQLTAAVIVGETATTTAAPDETVAVAADTAEAARQAYIQASTTPASAWLRRQLLQAEARLLAARRNVLRDSDEDAVHALRVACRRARGLVTLAAGLAPARRLKLLQRGLRGLAGAAAAVRDREVAIADLVRAARPELEPLIMVLSEELVTARRVLEQRLRDKATEQLLRRWALLVGDNPAWLPQPSVRNRLGAILYAHYEQVREHDQAGLPTDVAAQHALRLDVKRLRYQLEWWDTLPQIDTTRVLKPLIALQNVLGLANDLAVLLELIEPHTAASSPEIEGYLAERRLQAAAQAQQAGVLWQRVLSPVYRQALTRLIGQL